MSVLITYEQEHVLVTKEVANFLEVDRKKLAALGRQDRRHLSKSDFETVLGSDKTVNCSLEETVIKNLRLKCLQKEISKLSIEENQLLNYRFWEDMTLEEIGKIFGISKMAVSKRLNKLLSKMKSSVE